MFDENELQNIRDEYFQLVGGLCPEHAANIVNFYLAKRLRRIEFALFGIEQAIATKPQLTVRMPDGSAKSFGTKKDATGENK